SEVFLRRRSLLCLSTRFPLPVFRVDGGAL
ncbi:hypothetical protein ABIC12_004010, partial [Pantoea agglomerans]